MRFGYGAGYEMTGIVGSETLRIGWCTGTYETLLISYCRYNTNRYRYRAGCSLLLNLHGRDELGYSRIFRKIYLNKFTITTSCQN
jgi:hypothetical protein